MGVDMKGNYRLKVSSWNLDTDNRLEQQNDVARYWKRVGKKLKRKNCGRIKRWRLFGH
jgi:hypothetical protein